MSPNRLTLSLSLADHDIGYKRSHNNLIPCVSLCSDFSLDETTHTLLNAMQALLQALSVTIRQNIGLGLSSSSMGSLRKLTMVSICPIDLLIDLLIVLEYGLKSEVQKLFLLPSPYLAPSICPGKSTLQRKRGSMKTTGTTMTRMSHLTTLCCRCAMIA